MAMSEDDFNTIADLTHKAADCQNYSLAVSLKKAREELREILNNLPLQATSNQSQNTPLQ